MRISLRGRRKTRGSNVNKFDDNCSPERKEVEEEERPPKEEKIMKDDKRLVIILAGAVCNIWDFFWYIPMGA